MPIESTISGTLLKQPIATLSREEAAVLSAIRDTAFGAVEVVLHQARIVQVVRTERVRFDSSGREP